MKLFNDYKNITNFLRPKAIGISPQTMNLLYRWPMVSIYQEHCLFSSFSFFFNNSLINVFRLCSFLFFPRNLWISDTNTRLLVSEYLVVKLLHLAACHIDAFRTRRRTYYCRSQQDCRHHIYVVLRKTTRSRGWSCTNLRLHESANWTAMWHVLTKCCSLQ